MNKLVYIAMINWNGLSDTIECIDSVKENTYQNYKIILVDNGSTVDQIRGLREKYQNDLKVELIFMGKNTGFAGGTNIGIKRSLENRADFTLLLNNDTVVEKSFLEELVKVADSDLNIGVVTSKIYYHNEPSEIWSNGSYFNYYFPPLSKEYRGDVPAEVTDVVGCCMLVKNEVFEKVGLLDEEYFAYGEESDFNIRTRKAGFKLFTSPSSVIWHKVSRSTGGGFNKIVAYYKMRNKIKFAIKNYSFKYWPSYFIFLFLYFLKEQIKAIKKRKFDVSLALVKGVRDNF